MKRTVTFKGLNIIHNGFECYSHCRFCIIKRAKTNQIELQRAIAQTDRFHAWKIAKKLENYRVFMSCGRAFNFDLTSAKAIASLVERLNEYEIEISMGGMAFMEEHELETWLRERHEIGIRQIRLSLAGTAPLHDQWVGRPGDFAYHLNAARLAEKIGYQRNEWLFVSRSTIPHLEPLVAELDEIPGCTYRGFRIMNWENSKKLAAKERITRELYNRLPESVRQNIQFADEIKSEQEWLETIRDWPSAPGPEAYYLNLKLTKASIEHLERQSCDDIIADLEDRSRRIYEAIPIMKELGERHGDPHNPLMYHRSEIQRKWIQCYLQETSFKPERGLSWIY